MHAHTHHTGGSGRVQLYLTRISPSDTKNTGSQFLALLKCIFWSLTKEKKTSISFHWIFFPWQLKRIWGDSTKWFYSGSTTELVTRSVMTVLHIDSVVGFADLDDRENICLWSKNPLLLVSGTSKDLSFSDTLIFYLIASIKIGIPCFLQHF